MPRKEAKKVEKTREDGTDPNLEGTMDLPTSRSGTPAHQAPQAISTSKDLKSTATSLIPKKPKTPRPRKAEQKPDATRQKKISLFIRRHKFITEQSFGTYTTTQRRAFERDVYDFARALGFSKARAKQSMLGARTFCGEVDYDTDDTRLDDDEMDDSSDVLVSLPLSTGTETMRSSFARSFSATSPSIPWSNNLVRTGSEVFPSVEARGTPQSEPRPSKRPRKAVEGPSAGPNGKRRKTNSKLLDSYKNNGDADLETNARHSPALQKSDLKGRQETAANEHLHEQLNSKDPAASGVLETRSMNGAGGGTSSIDKEQAKNDQSEEGQHNSQEDFKGEKAKGKKHRSNPTLPSKAPNSGKKKRKRQHSEPEEQSAPVIERKTNKSTDRLKGTGNRSAWEEASSKPQGENEQSNGVVMNGTAEVHQGEEQSDLPMSELQQEKKRDDVKSLLDEEKSVMRENKKGKFDQLRENLQVLEARKQTKKKEHRDDNENELLKSQSNKTTPGPDKQKVDDSFGVRAQELLRAHDAARRAREEKRKTEDAVDGRKDQPAEPKKVETTALQRQEKNTKKRETKKKRQPEDASSTETEAVAAEYETACEPHEAQSSLSKTDYPTEDVVYDRPSTPIEQHASSAASSPLSSLPSTPPWPTPSRNTIKDEGEVEPKSKRRQDRSKSTALGLTPSTIPKPSSKVSPYFTAPPKPPREPISCIPFPPLSSTSFGLVQESLASNPFHLLIAVIFLNKTRGTVAIPVFYRFITRFPDPSSLAGADLPEVVSFFQNLGLQNQRAKKCIGLAKAWLADPPTKGKRWRRLHYPKPGDGKDIKSNEVPIPDEDPRVAWEVGHLPGIGAYGIDSWRIFCRDDLRGLGTAVLPELDVDEGSREKMGEEELKREWTRVVPLDKELRAYLRWRWLRLGWDWDIKTGGRRQADEKVMKEAEGGGVIYEGNEGWSLGNKGTGPVAEEIRSAVGLYGVEHGDVDQILEKRD